MATTEITAEQVAQAARDRAAARAERLALSGCGTRKLIGALLSAEVWVGEGPEVFAYCPRGPRYLAGEILDVDLGDEFAATAHITQVPGRPVYRITW